VSPLVLRRRLVVVSPQRRRRDKWDVVILFGGDDMGDVLGFWGDIYSDDQGEADGFVADLRKLSVRVARNPQTPTTKGFQGSP